MLIIKTCNVNNMYLIGKNFIYLSGSKSWPVVQPEFLLYVFTLVMSGNQNLVGKLVLKMNVKPWRCMECEWVEIINVWKYMYRNFHVCFRIPISYSRSYFEAGRQLSHQTGESYRVQRFAIWKYRQSVLTQQPVPINSVSGQFISKINRIYTIQYDLLLVQYSY